MSNTIREFAKNGFWVIAGKIVIFAISFAFITGLANLVPRETVGAYNFVMSVLGIVSITTLAGMNNALVRAVARGHEGSIKYMMRLRLMFGAIGSLISLVIGIVYLSQGESALGWTFIIASPFVPMTDTWSEMAYSFFQGRKQFKKTVFLAVLCQMIFSLPSLAVLFFTDNLLIISGSFFLFQTIGGLIVYSTARPRDASRDRYSERFGFHLTASGAPRTIATSVDKILVWYLLGPVAVASYVFASTPMNKLEQLIPIEMIALPDLSQTEPTPGVKKLLLLRTLGLVALMVPLVIAGVFLAPILFAIIFPKFPESVLLFQLLLISLVTTPFNLLKAAFTGWGQHEALYANELSFPVVKIICMTVFGIMWGMIGIIAGILVSRLIECIIVTILFLRIKMAPPNGAAPSDRLTDAAEHPAPSALGKLG